MATVYLAIQESLQRPVALKVLNSPDVPGFSERFLSEGRIIAALNHAHIVTIYDIGIHEGIHYISMEYVSGWPVPWGPPTSRGSCTGMSSPPTSCSGKMAPRC